jgi:hypothetical protein
MYELGERALTDMAAAVKHKLEILRSYVEEQEKLLELRRQQQIEQEQKILDRIRVEKIERKQRIVEAEELVDRIINQKQDVTCQPPETKGQFLYSLTMTVWNSWEEKQEEAIIAILKTAQTWNDYVEIVSHCSPGGQKISQEEGEKRLRKILDGKERNQFILLRSQLHKLPHQPQINTAAIQDNGLTLMA